MLNTLQSEAFNAIINNKSLFLTGPPGVGKSFTLNKIVDYLRVNDINYAITASTGAAALLIKGQTIHSFLGIGLGKDNVKTLYKNIQKRKKKYNELKNLELLIIDEISMIDLELFEKISLYLSNIKNNIKPFGDIKIILVGDFCQLPPINGGYCFQSKLWDKLNMEKIELKECLRQKEDVEFQKILNSIRLGRISSKTYNKLLNLKNTEFNNITPTKLYALNIDVNKINSNFFKIQYCTNTGKDLLSFNNNDIIENTIDCYKEYDINENYQDIPYSSKNLNENNYVYKYNFNTNNKKINKDDYNINLIRNLEIMITRNINIENGLVNGTRGYIYNLNRNHIS